MDVAAYTGFNGIVYGAGLDDARRFENLQGLIENQMAILREIQNQMPLLKKAIIAHLTTGSFFSWMKDKKTAVHAEYNERVKEADLPGEIPSSDGGETYILHPHFYFQALENHHVALPKTGDSFWGLHEVNVERSSNPRGAINLAYNAALKALGMSREFQIMEGEEDLERIGMDQESPLFFIALYEKIRARILS